MLRKNRRTLLIPVALAALLAAWALSYAQGPGCWMMPQAPGRGWSGPWVPEKYRLTEEQQRKIDEIHARYDEKILPLEKALSSKRLELEAYVSRPDASPEKVKAYRKEIRELEGQIEDLRVDARAEAAKVLTKEQREYFGDGYDFWGMGPGWRHYCPMMGREWGWGHGPMGGHCMGYRHDW